MFNDKTLTFKNSIEQANNNAINTLGKDIEDRPLTMEEMMKQRDTEMFNVKYLAEPVNPIISTNQEDQIINKSTEERLAELTNMNFEQSNIKTYVCTMFDHNVDINLLGILECYPPIYKFGPGFTLPFLTNEIPLPRDFVFKKSQTIQFDSNLSFVMKYGDDVFVNDYGNTGHMFIGSTFAGYDGTRCIKFIETSTNGNVFIFEYNKDKRAMTFISGDYHLTPDQCEILDGVPKR